MPMKMAAKIVAASAEPERVAPPSPPLVAFDEAGLVTRLTRIEDALKALSARPVVPESILARPVHPLTGVLPFLVGALATALVTLFARAPHGLSTFEYVATAAVGALVGILLVGVRR